MTMLLFAALAFSFAFAIYLAVIGGRQTAPAAFIDGGRSLPAWTFIFAGAGVLLGAVGLHDHFLLTARYGLQYSHAVLGLILAALCGVIVYKRLWVAARISGIVSPIELMGAYYGSVAMRIILMGLALLLAVPFAAYSLSLAADLIAATTAWALSREQAIFVLAFFLFLFSALGGWRGVVYAVAAQSFLLLALLAFSALLIANGLGAIELLSKGVPAAQGVLSSEIPGVVQYSAGIGKDVVSGGIWTTVAIGSFGFSLIGIVLSPAMGFFATTTQTRSGFAFAQVWTAAGLVTGLMLISAPLIGAEVAASDPAALAAGAPGYGALIGRLGAVDQLAALCFLLMLLASLQIVVAFFVAAGAHLLTLDLVCRFALPDLNAEGRRLATRIAVAALYSLVAMQAAFAPVSAAILGAVVLSLCAQLLPAYLGLLWAPWISRDAVLTGIVIGSLIVIFTEPPGLVAFEGLFLDLPWGRWPLTVHSAAWGLTFNLAACLLVSIFTRTGPERAHRDQLHEAFRRLTCRETNAPTLRTAKWSLTLIWAFLALGPGAILGNSFFSKPFFTDSDAVLGAPSLWIWQIVFWFIGVLLAWWLAYRGRLSILDEEAWQHVDLAAPSSPFQGQRTPQWIALLIERIAERQTP
jgi:solute:Na+ symporter, SSS family